MSHLTYAEAIIVGLIQGTTELFPVSSLGHNVLIPALVGGAPGADRVAGAHWSGQRAVRQQEMVSAIQADRRLTSFSFWQAVIIGSAQILALLAGISRDGVTMVAGMFRGLSREDAARFAFLLATPVILAAGVLKIPDLLSPLGNGIRPQILAGSVVAGVAAFLSVRFLMKYFQTRTLTPTLPARICGRIPLPSGLSRSGIF